MFEIGPFRLTPQAGVLTRLGAPEPLGPRAVAVLTHLVEHANEPVSKRALLDAAWPGVVVEEGNLSVQISAIRRVLAQVDGGDRWVETLARRGYRFVGPVNRAQVGTGPAPRTLERLSNLPEPLTSFIGRALELVDIKRLLPRCRLLTIAGAGGMGKTRLALQTATEVAGSYRDGVLFVDLAKLNDSTLVPSAIAQALSAPDMPGRPIVDALCTHLRGRELLLILDNCEHVLDAATEVVDALLRHAPALTAIATSRESLNIEGEQIYVLQPLSLPDASAPLSIVQRSEAVQLFVERAARRQPDFDVTAENAGALAELCTRLDGIPLALELAAARMHALSVDQIIARLHDRFWLLSSGSRTALARQQTLRATFDWSHDLLTPGERTVLRRLAIFLGGFTLEAAGYVAGDEEGAELDVIDTVSQLVAQSLLVAEFGSVGVRYRLLETTRAFALEKLEEAQEVDPIASKHAQYFLDRLQRAPDDWLRLPDKDWRGFYAPELHNVRAALDWAFGSLGDCAIGVTLVAASGPIWMQLSLPIEGRRWIETAIARIGPQTPELSRARLWLWLGMLLGEADPAGSIAAHERACECYRRLGEATGLGFSLAVLGYMYAVTGRIEQAQAVFAEAFPLLEDAGVPKALARLFECFGLLKMQTGDLESARANYEEALSLYRKTGADRAVPQLANIADLDWAIGNLAAAIAGFREVVTSLRRSPISSKFTLAFALGCLSGVLTEGGQLDDALAAARESLPWLREVGLGWYHLDHLALRSLLAGKPECAARLAGYADSVFAAKEFPRQPNEARARDRLRTLLIEEFGADRLAHLLDEGARMSERDACELALDGHAP
jgi:predicted ATPase/DNA-binding winged helix-turn-helix (wHTH) protein